MVSYWDDAIVLIMNHQSDDWEPHYLIVFLSNEQFSKYYDEYPMVSTTRPLYGRIYDVPRGLIIEPKPPLLHCYCISKFQMSYTKKNARHPCRDFKINQIKHSRRGEEIIKSRFYDERTLEQCIQSLQRVE